jgi:hypothetical protein
MSVSSPSAIVAHTVRRAPGAVVARTRLRAATLLVLCLATRLDAQRGTSTNARGTPGTKAAPAARATTTSTTLVRRLRPDSVWRKVWSIAEDESTDRFIEPRSVVATGDLAVVLDDGTREVHALDARTGATRFVLKPTGQGPGEFRRPAKLAATPTGFAVLDHANARLTAYDRRGKMEWDAILSDVFSIGGLCIGPGPRIVATMDRRDSSIVEFDTTGRRRAMRSIPWQELVRGGVDFTYAHSASSASPSGACVVAPLFGAEWAAIPESGPSRTYRVLDPGPQPVVVVTERVLERTLSKVIVQGNHQSDTPQASRGALVLGDTAIVYAAISKEFPLRMLDYYRLSTGEYLYSRKLPFVANGVTVGRDGTYYLTSIGPTRNVIIALRPATVAEATRTR